MRIRQISDYVNGIVLLCGEVGIGGIVILLYLFLRDFWYFCSEYQVEYFYMILSWVSIPTISEKHTDNYVDVYV